MSRQTPLPWTPRTIIHLALKGDVDFAATACNSHEDLLAALVLIQQARMAHHSGGDSAMIFDEFDAEGERERKGWWSVDESAFEGLDDLIAKTKEKP